MRHHPELKWANGGLIKNELEAQVLATIGPKDERDAPVKGKGKNKEKKKPAETAAKSEASKAADPHSHSKKAEDKDPSLASEALFFEGELARLHKPGGNKQIKPELMEQHLKTTGGIVRTRFPPEPNGFLHIGHAKAINVNFGYARAHNGTCYLRYDDTNPEAEEEIYFDSIKETVEWLGFKPHDITYSSDYFHELYELAIKLIKVDKAYVCHCTGEEIFAHRGGAEKGPRSACVHRNRPIEESLAEFEKMKTGGYKTGEAILRMKMDLENGNPQFWDLVAYRILYTPHHRTKDEWIIYPTYDFTHCLVDSFENISHSLCTTEFIQSRESYYWLCDAVEVYKPVQWEYGRLNVTNTVLSKRKVLELVNKGLVDGWDDPRLYTLPALRRRGVPPGAINSFVKEVGVTTAVTTIDVARLDNHIRDYLNETVVRLMSVINPVKVVIENLPADHHEALTVPNKPRDPSMGEHTVPFTNTLYIDASDFRTEDSKDYFRLAPGKTVGLLYVPHPITCTRFELDPNTNEPTVIYAKYENEGEAKKPKTYIQWIAESPKDNSPVRIDELRIYQNLFNHANPMDKNEVPGGWLSDVNTDSVIRNKSALLEVGIWDAIKTHLAEFSKAHPDATKYHNEEIRAQFVRLGYFALDKDSIVSADGKLELAENPKLVFNRIVTLKEDSKK